MNEKMNFHRGLHIKDQSERIVRYLRSSNILTFIIYKIHFITFPNYLFYYQ